jgi:hypothetical protein
VGVEDKVVPEVVYVPAAVASWPVESWQTQAEPDIAHVADVSVGSVCICWAYEAWRSAQLLPAAKHVADSVRLKSIETVPVD